MDILLEPWVSIARDATLSDLARLRYWQESVSMISVRDMRLEYNKCIRRDSIAIVRRLSR